jgi:hypothetical protein
MIYTLKTNPTCCTHPHIERQIFFHSKHLAMNNNNKLIQDGTQCRKKAQERLPEYKSGDVPYKPQTGKA